MSSWSTATVALAAQEYCSLAMEPVSGNGYSCLPSALLRAEHSFRIAGKSAAVNRSLCRLLLKDFNLRECVWDMPASLVPLYEVQLERIENNLSNKEDSYFSLTQDKFLKDLAILRHRLIPFGAELATPYSGIPRRLLVNGGWSQARRFIKAIADSGGWQPFLELHLHPDCTKRFTPRGWLDTYDNLADFLAVNPGLRGVQSSSWFLDPALERVSPHLAYLRQVPERCGAFILFAGADDSSDSAAFATSRVRRALHASGDYRPMRYTRIWPRQALLKRTWRDLQSPRQSAVQGEVNSGSGSEVAPESSQ